MSARTPLISIVVVNYNYERYLREAILSALGQTYDRVEAIIVDDGSTDGSRSIIEEYRDRATVLLQDNQGPNTAYFAGYTLARGDVIMFLDADDALRPDAAAKVAAAWRPALAKVQFSLEIIDGSGRRSGSMEPVYPRGYTQESVRREFSATSTYTWPPTSGNGFSRHFLEQVMPIPRQRFRFIDGVLNTIAPLFGDIHTLAEPLGQYRVHGNNLWALQRFSEARIRAYLAQRRDEFAYLGEIAARRGIALAPGDPLDRSLTFLRYQLVTAKLGEPPAGALTLLRLCLRGARRAELAELSATRRASELIWFVLVSLAFRSAARRLIEWRFDGATRPLWIREIARRLRSPTGEQPG